ncbi:hypothetical protein HFN_1109 [Helicobacter fennelliae MRY12-0050]|uniref:Uncharacterized protein n=1 Tax=Helicobacter fennelliae MRY12-0050 TaxID=1325130 RepID=T1CSR1_9HELI|nr:hypothetical protein HFN_1109 [Helicobacter fennelliae MRY12-0050]
MQVSHQKPYFTHLHQNLPNVTKINKHNMCFGLSTKTSILNAKRI